MERAGRIKDGAGAAGWKDFAAAAERCPSRGSDTGAIGRASNGQPEKICDQSAGDGDRDRYQQPARVHLGRSHAPWSFPADPGYVCTVGTFQRWRIHAIREGEEHFRSPLRKREGREISLQLQGSDRRQETRARYFAESRGYDRGAVTKPMHNLKYISIGGIWLVMLSGAPWRAQQQAYTPQDQQQGQQPSQPIPAIRSPLATGADNGDQDEAPNPQLMQPDTRSLTGVEDLSLGSMAIEHSYWQPRLSFSETVDSNPGATTAGNGSWGTWTSILGGVDIHRISGISELLVSYTGGGMFGVNSPNMTNGVVQELSLKEKYSFRRSTLSVFEQLSYLPESSFGFAGTAGASLPGVGTGGGVGSGFSPGQSILTPEGQNLSDSINVELDTKLTSRTSLTFVGGYSLLHYFDDNLLNYGDTTFQAGYNYLVSRKDTVAISYNFSAFRYSNVDQSLNLNTIQGSYARRITGRMAFQIAAGPQFLSSRFPITSSTTSTTSSSQLYWTLNTSLQYQRGRAQISATYNHGV